MDVNFPALTSINNGVSLAYNTQFDNAPSVYNMFTTETTSDGDAEEYPRLDMIVGMREWVGERVVHALSTTAFAIRNKTFENTISVKRENIEDDRYGFLGLAAGQLGLNAKHLPDLLIASLMANGHTTIGIDNQGFFDTAHPNYTPAGGTTTLANYQPGASTSWYLFDNSQMVRPFIYQKRRPFVLVPKFQLSDDAVFWDNEFVWGVDGRCNAGYGLWQYAFRSDAPLTLANLINAQTLMAQWTRPDGAPMGITPTHLVVPPSLYPTAKAYCDNAYDPLGVAGLTPNTFQGMAQAVRDPWLR